MFVQTALMIIGQTLLMGNVNAGGLPPKNQILEEFVLIVMCKVVYHVSEDIPKDAINVKILKHLLWMDNASVLRE